jgi:hypothetical protein
LPMVADSRAILRDLVIASRFLVVMVICKLHECTCDRSILDGTPILYGTQ